MSEAHFFHETLYRFSDEAVREISRRFKARVQDLNVRVWYKPPACPTDVGPAADEALCEIIADYIQHDVLDAVRRGLPALAHLWLEAETDPFAKLVNATLPETRPSDPAPRDVHRPRRFVIAGELAQPVPGLVGSIQQSAKISLNSIRMCDLPPHILQRVLTSNKPRDYSRVLRSALLCHIQTDKDGHQSINVGKTKLHKPDSSTVRFLDTMAQFPILEGHGVRGDALPALPGLDADASLGNAMDRFLAEPNAKMDDPQQMCAAPRDALEFQQAPRVGVDKGRVRVAKINIHDMSGFEDSDDEDGDDQETHNFHTTAESFRGLLGIGGAKVTIPTQSQNHDVPLGASTTNPNTALTSHSTNVNDNTSDNPTALPEYDPKFGLVNKYGALAGDAKSQALWNRDNYDPAIRAPVSAGPTIVLRTQPPRSSHQSLDHRDTFTQSGVPSDLGYPQVDARPSRVPEITAGWERRIVGPEVKLGNLIDDTTGRVNDLDKTMVPPARRIPPSVSHNDFEGMYGSLSEVFSPPSPSASEQVEERLGPELLDDRKFNTMNQQAKKKKGKNMNTGKDTAKAQPAQLPLPDHTPARRVRRTFSHPTNSQGPPPDQPDASAPPQPTVVAAETVEDAMPLPPSLASLQSSQPTAVAAETAEEATSSASGVVTAETMEDAMSSPPSLASLVPFIAALLHKHSRLEVTFGIAPLIRKSQEAASDAQEQGPGWWQRALNKDSQLLKPIFLSRLTTSAQDAAWMLMLSRAKDISAEASYSIRTRSAVGGKLENHILLPDSKPEGDQTSRSHTFEDTALAYLHYPKMIWDAKIAAFAGKTAPEEIKLLGASMQTRGEPPSFFANLPSTYSEVVQVHARREFEKSVMLKGTYLIVTEVQELEVVPVKSPHFSFAALCESRQEMIEQHRLWYEARLVFENVPPEGANVVQYFIHEFASCMEVVGQQNEGPWMSTGPQPAPQAVEIPESV